MQPFWIPQSGTYISFRVVSYTEGVVAGSPGLAMRSELPWVRVDIYLTP